MKHILNILGILAVLIAAFYIFKDELFYSPKKIENTGEIAKNSVVIKDKKKSTIKNKEKLENKSIKQNSEETIKQEKKQENNKEGKEKLETITGKGKILNVYKENNSIKGKLNLNNEILEFEAKYDPDIMLLLEDAKKYNLPLTFVIKKQGNKAYIEEVK